MPFSTPVVRPVVLIETAKFTGVVPLAGETLSQELPEVTAAFTAVGLPAPTANCWDAGGVPPGV